MKRFQFVILGVISIVGLSSPASAASGVQCNYEDPGLGTLLRQVPRASIEMQPAPGAQSTLLSIGDGEDWHTSEVMIPGAKADAGFRLDLSTYLANRLKRCRDDLLKQANAIGDEKSISLEPGSPGFNRSVALKYEVFKINTEIAHPDDIKNTASRYASLIGTLVAECGANAKGGAKASSCSGDASKHLNQQLDRLESYDKDLERRLPAMAGALKVSTLLAYSSKDGVRTLAKDPLLGQLGIGLVQCSATSCEMSDGKPRLEAAAAKPVIPAPIPPKKRTLSAGEEGGKSLSAHEIQLEGLKFAHQLSALAQCASVHTNLKSGRLGGLDSAGDARMDKEFDADLKQYRVAAKKPMPEDSADVQAFRNLVSQAAEHAQVSTQISPETIHAMEILADPSSSGGFMGAYRKFTSGLAQTYKVAVANAGDDEGLLNGLKTAYQDVLAQYALRPVVASSAACKELNDEVGYNIAQLKKAKGVSNYHFSKPIYDRKGDCLANDSDMIENLGHILTDVTGATDSDSTTIEKMKDKLSSPQISPSARAVIYEMIALYNKENIKGSDEAKKAAARAKLSDLVTYLTERLTQ